jgi:hypothetical protein
MTNTIDATEVDVVQEQLDSLRNKRREVDALYTQLENSHKIKKLVPDAFEHGACKQTWVDSLGRKTVKFKVTRGDDSVREIPFEELPEDFVNHIIKEKGIVGVLYLDNKKCGKSLLVEKLSQIVSDRKGRERAKAAVNDAKKRREQRLNS